MLRRASHVYHVFATWKSRVIKVKSRVLQTSKLQFLDGMRQAGRITQMASDLLGKHWVVKLSSGCRRDDTDDVTDGISKNLALSLHLTTS